MSKDHLEPGDVVIQRSNHSIWWMERPIFRHNGEPALVGRCIHIGSSTWRLWDGDRKARISSNYSPFTVAPTHKGVEYLGRCPDWEAALVAAQLAGEEGFCEQG